MKTIGIIIRLTIVWVLIMAPVIQAQNPPASAQSQDSTSKETEAASWYQKGVTSFEGGDYEQAIEYYERALEVSREVKDRTGEIRSLLNLGDTHSKLDRYDKALEYYEQAMAIAREMKDGADGKTAVSSRQISHKLDIPLEPGNSVEREIAYRYIQYFQITLRSSQYLRISLTRRSADVTGILIAPDGSRLAEVSTGDAPQETTAMEAIADQSGSYRLAIMWPTKAGTYQVMVEALRDATDQERHRITAERAFKRAILFFEQWEKASADKNQLIAVKSMGAATQKFEEARRGWHEIGDRAREADALAAVANLYFAAGELHKALDHFDQLLTLRRGLNDRPGEAEALNSLAFIYNFLGEYQKSLDHAQGALSLYQALGNRQGQIEAISAIGLVYLALGEVQKVFSYESQMFQLFRHDLSKKTTPLEQSRAVAYDVMAQASEMLAQMTPEAAQKAAEKFEEAISLLQPLGDRFGESTALYHAGLAYLFSGSKSKAANRFSQALEIERTTGNRMKELIILPHLGLLYNELGEREKGLEYLGQALRICREFGSRLGEVGTLSKIAEVYLSAGDGRKALENCKSALAINREVKSPVGEGFTLYLLMLIYKSLGKPSIGVFFGKQAVNISQRLRASNQLLTKELQESLLKTKAGVYRELADLLISLGRLPEAEQVLGLLKEEEYFQFVRRDGNEAANLNARADLNREEAEWERRYREIADRVTAIGTQRGHLLAKNTLSADEEQLLTRLDADLVVANTAFQKFLDQLEDAFGKSSRQDARVYQLRESEGLMEDLRELGAGTVALYTLVTDERYRVIFTTPDARVAREYSIKAADLNRKVLEFREAVQNPRLDPLPLAQELYHILIGPVAKDLEQAGAKTLMWSLDGVLRYLPIAALHDGKRYMVERYRNVVYTPASKPRLKDPVSAGWKGLALGVSKQHEGFRALPAVINELKGIIREEEGKGEGVVPGTVRLDEAFTGDEMKSELRKRYKLVHIASHFQFRPGNETDSFLLLGDGSRMTLEEVKNQPNIFGGVELLTLSACDTATGGAGADGKEVEGFGVLAQRKGAKAVVASLWPVADESTSLLMKEFYRQREANPGTPKAEAMRQAQVGLLLGSVKLSEERETKRSERVEVEGEENVAKRPLYKKNPDAPYSHPYYWAPFILIGNWR